MTFKKILTVMTVALSALVLAGAAFAADTVGTIDTQKVMFQHPKFQQVQRQVRDVTEKLQKDAQAAIDKESDNKKKARPSLPYITSERRPRGPARRWRACPAQR